MPLTDRDKDILSLVAKYNLLNYCRDKGLISEDTRQEILFSFGAESHEILEYYNLQIKKEPVPFVLRSNAKSSSRQNNWPS